MDDKYEGWLGLTLAEMDSCIDGNMKITDHLLRDAIYAVIVDVEMTLKDKNDKRDENEVCR